MPPPHEAAHCPPRMRAPISQACVHARRTQTCVPSRGARGLEGMSDRPPSHAKFYSRSPRRPGPGFLETYSFLTEHARTKTHISKKRLTLVGKYSHAASEVALLRTPLKNTRPSSSHMQTSVEQAGGSAAERRVRPGGARRRAEIGCTCVEASDQTNTGGESEAQMETRDLTVRPESLPPQRH